MSQTSTGYDLLKVERHDDGVTVVSLNNPPMNLINPTFGLEMSALVDELAADDSIRAVLFRSEIQGVFIAGADISMFNSMTPELLEQLGMFGDVYDRLARMPHPTVAAIGGMALGGGFEFALACDFRIMSDGFGEIGLPEVRLGVLPGAGGTQRLPRLVGAGRATEMLLKGMRYGPQQALELGLLHKVVEADSLDAEALKYTQALARQATLAVRAIKRLIRASFETPGDEGLRLERQLFQEVLQTQDAAEGASAFLEGRKPTFSVR